MHALDVAIEEFLNNPGFPSDISRYVYPIRRAYMIRERMDLLRIKSAVCAGESISEQLRKHASKYGWMSSVNWRFEPYDMAYYQKVLEELTCDTAKSELKDLKNSKKRNESGVDNYLEDKGQIVGDIIYSLRRLLDAKMLNWDVVGISVSELRRILQSEAEFRSLPYDRLIWLTVDELLSVKSGKMTFAQADALIDSRLVHRCALYRHDQTNIVGLNEDELREIEGVLDVSEDHSESFVSGQSVFSGKVTGTVKIIMSAAEASGMLQGGVLVCPMTNPDFMPAILRASAIVTDEGGILCHATIVSRELKKPCIIGTKIATKVLKDGDLVEVDADNEVVRILEKK